MYEEQKSEFLSKKIVISNKFIRTSVYSLGIVDQKLLFYMLSLLGNCENNHWGTVEFGISDFLKISGTEISGSTYKKTKESLKNLSECIVCIQDQESTSFHSLIESINSIFIAENNIRIKVCFNENLKMHFLETSGIEGGYTKFKLSNILSLKSKHSIRLYTLCKSYMRTLWKVTPDEFLDSMGLKGKYDTVSNIKSFVINPSIEEINKYTDITIKCERIMSKRTIGKYVFESSGKSYGEIYNLEKIQMKRLYEKDRKN